MFDWTVKLHHTNNVKGSLKKHQKPENQYFCFIYLKYIISNEYAAHSLLFIRKLNWTDFKLDTAYSTGSWFKCLLPAQKKWEPANTRGVVGNLLIWKIKHTSTHSFKHYCRHNTHASRQQSQNNPSGVPNELISNFPPPPPHPPKKCWNNWTIFMMYAITTTLLILTIYNFLPQKEGSRWPSKLARWKRHYCHQKLSLNFVL